MGCVKSKSNTIKKITRFQNDISDDDIMKMIEKYPEGIMYTFSVDSDKFIYKVHAFSSKPSVTKIPKKIMFVKVIPDEEETCCICLDKIENDCVKLNLCSHKFHEKCIEKTLNHLGESCPMCRASIDNVVINNYYESLRERSINSDYSYDSD